MRIAVPNKGRLHEPSIELLERAGLHVDEAAERKLYAHTVDPEVSILYVRAADIPGYVADGAADLGITGLDQVHESGHDLVDLLDLGFGACRLVLAAPEDGAIDSVEDLADATVATEFPRITREYFAERDVEPDIVEVTGATELTPHVDMADAIVDITSTGTTLRVNNLGIVDEVLESSVRLFAREDVVDDPKVEQIRTALGSVLTADGKRYLMLNAPEGRLEEIREALPGLGGPTVMEIIGRGDSAESSANRDPNASGDDMVAVHVVVDERDVFETVARVKELGASGILVTEIERLIE
jgi:ATP phosphoribosyltransferase